MINEIDIVLYNYMGELLRHTPTGFQRYLYDDIDWNARLVGIVGPRGVGKSTMLLQHILATGVEDTLFVSADNTYFSTHTLVSLAEELLKENGKRLFIDEIHKYKGWSKELKEIYDAHPGLQIFFTGSSILEINKGQADLSRRALVYSMEGLSFREYLELFHNIEVPVYTLYEILANKVVIPGIEHPLPLFKEYLREGYYPFALEGNFPMRMQNIITQTIEVDIAQYADLKASTARKLKRMLSVVSTLVPFKPSMESLSQEIGVSKNNVGEYLIFLERAGLLGLLCDDTGGIRGLGKMEKVYLNNPSLISTLAGDNVNIGNVRETFFYSQMRVRNNLVSSKHADFRIGDITFEIGGKNKGFQQLEGVSNGYVVRDDIEYGHGRIIPLWTFGFNY